jgi:sirohydrochlorin cobaltochelatase
MNGCQLDRGLLIVGHGTRQPDGTAEFHQTVAQVRERLPQIAVQPCFLEIARPTILEAAELLARRGVRRVSVLPLMLLAAGHVKRDIPAATDAAAAALAPRYGPIHFRLTAHLGLQDELITLSTRRYRQCADGSGAGSAGATAADRTQVLVVGRGSRDPAAADELRRFVQLRCEHTPVVDARVCFMAMAEPSLVETLEQSRRASWGRVVVQPHLLFRGRLLSRLEQLVHHASMASPKRQWLLTRHIGPDPLLADLIVRLAGAG